MQSLQQPVKRRNIVRGAAWAVPIVTVVAAAPAFAASTCTGTTTTLQWNEGTGVFSGTPLPDRPDYGGATIFGYSAWTYQPTAFAGLTVTASSSYTGGSIPTSASLAMRGTTGTYPSGINFGWFAGTSYSGGATSGTGVGACWTISFNRMLCGLTFALTDIDYGVRENIWISSTNGTYTYSITNPTYVGGAGTSANPWHSLLPSPTDIPNDTSPNGNVVISYTSPVSTITFCADSRNGTASKFQENIAMSGITFNCLADPCPPV